MKAFNPSQVNPNFSGSTFRKLEKECLVAHIVTFLAENGDEWDCEIEVKVFFAHNRNYKFELHLYNNPLANQFVCEGFVNAMYNLIDEGFVIWTEERNFFKVTEKLIQFYSRYVAISE
jgi:hypothetical protein